jgi:hypothetical protein
MKHKTKKGAIPAKAEVEICNNVITAEAGKPIDAAAVIALADACKANAEAIAFAAQALKGTENGVIHNGIFIESKP